MTTHDAPLGALAFAPHPDDAELFCGGTLITLADRGHRVGVVDLTAGELASRGDPATRAQEATAAAQIMGLAHRECLGLPDGGVDAQSGAGAPPAVDSQLGIVVQAIRRLRPELVLLPWVEARHPDHQATGLLVRRALFFAGLKRFETGLAPHRPTRAMYYPMRHRVAPSVVVDITAALDRKIAAIRCHASQVGPTAPGAPATLVGSPLALQAIEARDRYHGALIGVAAGEPLRTEGPIGLADPLAHIRAEPFDSPHFFEGLT